MGCVAHAIDALLAGVAGRAAMMVTPVRASVTDSAEADEAVSTPLGRVGLAFWQPSANAQSAATPATPIFLLNMCTYRTENCVKRTDHDQSRVRHAHRIGMAQARQVRPCARVYKTLMHPIAHFKHFGRHRCTIRRSIRACVPGSFTLC